MAKRFIVVAIIITVVALQALFAQTWYDQGLEYFMNNKPLEASVAFEKAIRDPGADERAYLYLGIAYIQLQRYDEALLVLQKGTAKAIAYTHLFYFNIGNVFFIQNKNEFAIEAYTSAINAKPDYAPAYLNRANARLRIKDFINAVPDYKLYLSFDPESYQRETIQKLIDLLTAQIAQAQQAQALLEAQKLAEAQAQAALQAAIAQSLIDAASNTTNLSTGSGDFQGYDDPLQLDD